MQKVTALLPSWDTTKSSSKKGFDKVWGWSDKLGAPINRLTNKIGSEAFWPTTLDKESDKAARILRSFCKDGFYTQEDRPTGGPNQKSKVLKKIPAEVIQNAVGLAIFTVMRTGLWISGAGGSGVLIARQEDGTWSPPSGIMLHTAGLGFLVGVDIYDCVVVINNRKALEAFTKVRATLGGEISAVAGPVGIGGVLEHDGKWNQLNKPVFTYLKSRGFYAGVQVDGTIVIERMDENERFYGQKLPVADILAGKVRHPPLEIKMLMETVKAAEGRSDIDQALMRELEDQPAPGDVGVEMPTRRHSQSRGPIFGLPEIDDPDPFGVLALQKAGLEIREAGTGSRPSSEAFEFKPSPASPIYGHFRKMSQETWATRSNRESYMSNRTRTSTDRATQTIEVATQTEASFPNTPLTSPSLWNESRNVIPEEQLVKEPDDIDYTKIDLGPYSSTMTHSDSSEFQSNGTTMTDRDQDPVNDHSHDETVVIRNSDADSDADDEEEEPVVFEVAAVQTTGPILLRPQVIKTRGSIVDIPKRVPPPLPPRNPIRARGGSVSHSSISSPAVSPTADGFEDAELNGSTRVLTVHEVLSAETPDEKPGRITMMDNEPGNEPSYFINDIHPESPQTPVAVNHVDAPREVTTVDAAEKPVLHVNSFTGTHAREADESDDFHSIPTTPNEL